MIAGWRRGAGVLAAAGVGLGLLAACGVPTSGVPSVIPASEVPYGLASRTPTPKTSESTETMMLTTAIYLVAPDDTLVATGREVPAGDLEHRLGALLDELSAGPTAQERADELSTALPPEVELSLIDVSGDTVTIEIGGSGDAPAGAESRRAVAQIVLTATTVQDVRAVRLARDGELIEAPLPDGELTSARLTAADYAALLTAPTPTASPRSAPSTSAPAPSAVPAPSATPSPTG